MEANKIYDPFLSWFKLKSDTVVNPLPYVSPSRHLPFPLLSQPFSNVGDDDNDGGDDEGNRSTVKHSNPANEARRRKNQVPRL